MFVVFYIKRSSPLISAGVLSSEGSCCRGVGCAVGFAGGLCGGA